MKQKKHMRHSSTLALFLIGSLAGQAQSLTNVIVTPSNPTSCQLLTFNFIGSMPQNANFSGFSPDFDADSLNVALSATGGGGGNANFNQELSGLGPFAPGTYTVYVTFTLNGNLVGTDSQTITIVQGTDPDAGEYAEQLGLCTGGPPVPLISFLGGTPDTYGVWVDPNSQVVTNGMFVPGQSPAGFYTYQFNVQLPCQSTAQQVLVTYADVSANAGLNSSVETCPTAGAPFDLFSVLGGTPDAGGTWSFNSQPHSNIFTPVTDACGNYTYTVPGLNGCPPASAIVDVNCVNPPNAGSVSAANDTIIRCWNDTIELMQTLITGEQNTGAWLSPSSFIVGLYNDSINLALNGPGLYGYMVPHAVCPNDTTFIYVMLWGDGIPNCQQIIGMAEADGGLARFDVLPNPAQDEVTVDVELLTNGGSHTLEIVDMDGKTVRRQALVFNGLLARRTLAVGDLARGVYLVRVSSAEGRAVRRLMLR